MGTVGWGLARGGKKAITPNPKGERGGFLKRGGGGFRWGFQTLSRPQEEGRFSEKGKLSGGRKGGKGGGRRWRLEKKGIEAAWEGKGTGERGLANQVSLGPPPQIGAPFEGSSP